MVASVNQSKQRYSSEKRADGTIAIKIVVPASEIEQVRKKIIDELVKNVEIQGFRKGAAPRNLAEQKLNLQTVREEVLKKILTDEYVAAVKQLDIKPIINPRIHVGEFAEGTDLEFTAETAEEPKIDLKNYKEEARKLKPTPKIILPHSTSSGQAGQPETEDEPSNPSTSSGQGKLDEILNTILNVVEIQIPKILIDQETDRLLSQLLDELKKLGVSLDQYLASRSKTAEQLRGEYNERAEKDLKLEFVLRKIADEEKITVEQKDIDQALAAIKDEKERTQVAQNPYLVAAIIRQQKTLDYLTKI